MKKLSPAELDELCERLELLDQESGEIRAQLKAHVEEHGFIPPRAEKSKRLEGEFFRATLSFASQTTVIDTEVVKIQEACDGLLFARLFREVKKYTVADSAHYVLAGTLPEGAPRNLRRMFERAVIMAERSPSLKIERPKKAKPNHDEMSELRERKAPATACA
jgi:hypothetical protein